jgi:hypothetical protein
VDLGKADVDVRIRADSLYRPCRGVGDGMQTNGDWTQHGKPRR